MCNQNLKGANTRTIITPFEYFFSIGVIVIGAYFITSSFFNVYSMAVDTLFLCFLEDLERNGPNGPYFMPKSILKIIGKMEQYNQARGKLNLFFMKCPFSLDKK